MNYCPSCGKKYVAAQTVPEEERSTLSYTDYTEVEVDTTTNSNRVRNKKRSKKKKIWLPIIIIFLIVIGVSILIPKLYSFSDNSSAIQKASESVLMLSCYDSNGILCATGSGFVLFDENTIVTNYHVIESDAYKLTGQTETGRIITYNYIIAYDKDHDIAILRSDGASQLSPLKEGYSGRLKKGDEVVAIGSPLGFVNTVSTGSYSGPVTIEDQTFLQFSAPISAGSSGGALFDKSGNVIGITTAIYEGGQNLNFAVPIESVVELWNGRNESSAQSLKDFYNSTVHTKPVDYIIQNYGNVIISRNKVEGYVSSISLDENNNTVYLVGDPYLIDGNIYELHPQITVNDKKFLLEYVSTPDPNPDRSRVVGFNQEGTCLAIEGVKDKDISGIQPGSHVLLIDYQHFEILAP